MSEPIVRDDFTRAEAVWGIIWLSIGAAVSALLEAVYLGSTVFGVPLPLAIPIAFLFNGVLTRTARLWTRRRLIVLVPLAVWLAAFSASAYALLPINILPLLLMVAGLAGGVWPLARNG